MTNTPSRFRAHDNPEPDSRTHADTLTKLELEVARRADELARNRPLPTSLNLHCWLLAEAEILAARTAMLAHGCDQGGEVLAN